MPIFLLGVAIIIYFLPVLIKKGFFWIDFLFYYFQSWNYKYERLTNFELPFWNPYTFSGHPFFADHQNGVFYPLDIIGFLFYRQGNFEFNYWLFELQVVFNLFLGGVFMYVLARNLNITKWGSLISSLIFTLGGFMPLHMGQINVIYSSIWLPLIFLYFYKTIIDFKFKYLMLSGLFLGVSMLGAHAQTVYIIIFGLTVFAFLYPITSQKSFWINSFKKGLDNFKNLIFIVFIGLIIAFPQLFSGYEYYKLSTRKDVNIFFSRTFSLDPIYFFVTQFFPHLYGGFNNKVPYFGPYNYWEMTSYIGLLSLVFIVIGFMFFRQHNLIRSLSIIFILSILISFGGNFIVYYLFYFLVPGFGLFRVPARFLLLFCFFAAIIAGIGFDKYFNYRYKIAKILNIKLFKIIIALFILLFLAFSYEIIFIVARLLGESRAIWLYNHLLYFAKQSLITFFFLVTVITFLFKYHYFFKEKILKAVIIVILFVDLFIYGYQFNAGEIKPGDVYKRSQIIQFLEEKLQEEVFRFSASTSIINPNAPLLYKLYSINGEAGMFLKDYQDFLETVNHLNINRLSLLNIKYIILQEEIEYKDLIKIKEFKDEGIVYQNKKFLPRAFIVKNYKIIKDKKEILKLIDREDFNPYNIIYFNEEIYLPSLPFLLNNSNFEQYHQDVKIISYKPEEIILKTNANFDGFLFLSEIYYPAWKAEVDGQETKIYKANYTFRSLYLPKGEHSVRFYYQKPFPLKLIRR